VPHTCLNYVTSQPRVLLAQSVNCILEIFVQMEKFHLNASLRVFSRALKIVNLSDLSKFIYICRFLMITSKQSQDGPANGVPS